jgi:hypothetical protein
MAEPTEDQILQKAQQLCREDGKLWSAYDLEQPLADRTASVVDESSRTEYLNRARQILREARV